MRKYAVIWWLCILSVIMLVGVYYLSDGFRYRLEKHSEEIELGPAFEARSNPYLAAERFLAAQDIGSKRIERLEQALDLEPAGQSLLLLDPDNSLTPQQTRALLQWISQGGHLLLLGTEPLLLAEDADEQNNNPMLSDALGIYAYNEQDETEEISTTPLHVGDTPRPLELDMRTDKPVLWSDEVSELWLGDGDSTFLLQITYGKGRVTVVADPDMWNNQQIGKQDNAWLLWYLVQDTAVSLLYDNRHDNLWTLLLRHFPLALALLALLIVAIVWHCATRHGPLLAPVDRSRRQLREHLHASAEFQLHHGGQASLIESLQQDILRRVKRRHPGFERLSAAEQMERLGRLSGQSLEQLATTLQPPDRQRKLSGADFSRLIAALQTLRNAL